MDKITMIFGDSIAYGVGGKNGGWPDLFKKYVHNELYGSSKKPPFKNYVYNLAQPSTTTKDLLKTLEGQVRDRNLDNCTLEILIAIGINDTKSFDMPENYTSTEEIFELQVKEIISLCKKYTNHITFFGFTALDESLRNPKIESDGTKKFMTNTRVSLFDRKLRSICEGEDVTHIDILSRLPKNWISHCLSSDGLHPNEKGHKILYDIFIEKYYSLN